MPYTGWPLSMTVPDRSIRARHGLPLEKDILVKKLGLATLIAGGMTAAVLGFAGPAQADIDHQLFINEITQPVFVPHVDTTVHQSH